MQEHYQIIWIPLFFHAASGFKSIAAGRGAVENLFSREFCSSGLLSPPPQYLYTFYISPSQTLWISAHLMHDVITPASSLLIFPLQYPAFFPLLHKILVLWSPLARIRTCCGQPSSVHPDDRCLAPAWHQH